MSTKELQNILRYKKTANSKTTNSRMAVSSSLQFLMNEFYKF